MSAAGLSFTPELQAVARLTESENGPLAHQFILGSYFNIAATCERLRKTRTGTKFEKRNIGGIDGAVGIQVCPEVG
jgi:hypothetical protein